jgi:hypothetical protein
MNFEQWYAKKEYTSNINEHIAKLEGVEDEDLVENAYPGWTFPDGAYIELLPSGMFYVNIGSVEEIYEVIRQAALYLWKNHSKDNYPQPQDLTNLISIMQSVTNALSGLSLYLEQNEQALEIFNNELDMDMILTHSLDELAAEWSARVDELIRMQS